MMNRLKTLSLLSVSALLLSGCATYAWVKPGGDPASFPTDSYACKQEATSTAPPAYRVYDPFPAPFAPPYGPVRCYDHGDHEVCRIRHWPQPMQPWPPTAVDLNAGVRDDLYGSCLNAKGWFLQQVEPAR